MKLYNLIMYSLLCVNYTSIYFFKKIEVDLFECLVHCPLTYEILIFFKAVSLWLWSNYIFLKVSVNQIHNIKYINKESLVIL